MTTVLANFANQYTARLLSSAGDSIRVKNRLLQNTTQCAEFRTRAYQQPLACSRPWSFRYLDQQCEELSTDLQDLHTSMRQISIYFWATFRAKIMQHTRWRLT